MKTTLNLIRAASPCASGWTKLLKHLGKTAADDEPLCISTVLASNGLDAALWCLRAVPDREKEIRLYAVWCARQVQHLMTDPRSLAALDVAERFAHGDATEGELKVARGAAWNAADAVAWNSAAVRTPAAWTAAGAAAGAAEAGAGAAAVCAARGAAWAATADARAARAAQAEQLLKICTNVPAEPIEVQFQRDTFIPPEDNALKLAYEIGTKGAPHSESERALFEEYMRGHCWACDSWNPSTCDYANQTQRVLYAVFRARAAIAAQPAAPVVPAGQPVQGATPAQVAAVVAQWVPVQLSDLPDGIPEIYPNEQTYRFTAPRGDGSIKGNEAWLITLPALPEALASPDARISVLKAAPAQAASEPVVDAKGGA